MIHFLFYLSTQFLNLEYVTPVEWLVQRKTSDMVEPTNKSVLLNAKSVHVIDGVGRWLALCRHYVIHTTDIDCTI